MISGGWELCLGGYCTGPDIVYEQVLEPIGEEIAEDARFVANYYAEDWTRLPRNFGIGAAIPLVIGAAVVAPEVVVPAAVAVTVGACSSDDDSHNGGGDTHVDSDGGDVHTDVGDTEISDVPDGGDETDGGETDATCSLPRAGINDEYAPLRFSSTYAPAVDVDIINRKIYGVTGQPLNTMFSCQIGSDPMASTSCSQVFTVGPRSTLPDGTTVENDIGQLENLGDGRIAVIYNTPAFDAYPNNLVFLNDLTHVRTQSDIALGAVIYGSGSGAITVRPRLASGALLVGGYLYLTTRNYDASRGQYERGTVYMIPPRGVSDRDFNPAGASIFFTNGRNPVAIGRIDDDTIAILNANGAASEIPSTLGPEEVAGASIDIVDVTDPAVPVITRTIPVADVALATLPELTLSEDRTRAFVGDTNSPPAIYRVTLTDPSSVQQVTLSADAAGETASIDLSDGSPSIVLVSMSGGNLYEVNADTMSVMGSAILLGGRTDAAVYDPEGIMLYPAVTDPYCGEAGSSYIIAVDPAR